MLQFDWLSCRTSPAIRVHKLKSIYRIFLNVAISCILLCLSQFDNKLVRQSQIVQNAIDSSGTVYSILIQGPKQNLQLLFTLVFYVVSVHN